LFTDTETLSGGKATGAGYTATATGTDYWVAIYNGDSNNSSVSSGAAAEPVTITPATPTISTTQQPPSATVGSSIADTATVSGGFNPTGTVTFNLYNNPNATGTPLFTDTESLVSGGATNSGYTATAAGTDYWVATYNGDSNNTPVTSGTSSEPVAITITPSALCLITAQDVEGSTKFKNLPPPLQNAVKQLVAAACGPLDKIVAGLNQQKKAALIAAYDNAVNVLAKGDWLTTSQAAYLKSLAATL
jgi:hypothetical protein